MSKAKLRKQSQIETALALHEGLADAYELEMKYRATKDSVLTSGAHELLKDMSYQTLTETFKSHCVIAGALRWVLSRAPEDRDFQVQYKMPKGIK